MVPAFHSGQMFLVNEGQSPAVGIVIRCPFGESGLYVCREIESGREILLDEQTLNKLPVVRRQAGSQESP